MWTATTLTAASGKASSNQWWGAQAVVGCIRRFSRASTGAVVVIGAPGHAAQAGLVLGDVAAPTPFSMATLWA
jgi:hypothetical protein